MYSQIITTLINRYCEKSSNNKALREILNPDLGVKTKSWSDHADNLIRSQALKTIMDPDPNKIFRIRELTVWNKIVFSIYSGAEFNIHGIRECLLKGEWLGCKTAFLTGCVRINCIFTGEKYITFIYFWKKKTCLWDPSIWMYFVHADFFYHRFCCCLILEKRE